MWTAIQFVSSGFTLAAFFVAVAAWAYRRKLLADSELIRTAPKEERKALVFAKYGKLFDIDTTKLTKQQSYDLAVEQIRTRAKQLF